MPYAFGHMIGCWGLAKLYEKARRARIGHMEWGLLLFGAILPDADLLFDWTFGTTFHRGFMHSLLFALLVGLAVYAAAGSLKKTKPASYGLAIGLGIVTHIALDMTLGRPGIMIFWPYDMGFWFFGIAPYPPHTFFSENLARLLKSAILDMALGTAWLGYFWLRRRIRF